MVLVDLKELIASFSNDQKQYISFTATNSTIQKVTTSASRGSVFGPFLFLIIKNDLDKRIEDSQLAMSPDDTTIIKTRHNASPLIDNDIRHMS